MAGEDSKTSGEIGEALASKLLQMIGWQQSIRNISIDCNTPAHLNEAGNRRTSHGEDRVFLYNSPFHDDRTDLVHVSVKNVLGSYPKAGTLRSKFKEHMMALHETIDCAKFSPKIDGLTTDFRAKPSIFHSGLLVWLHNDHEDVEKDIKPELATSRLDIESSDPVYVIDNARASFLLKVVDDLKRRAGMGQYEFYYPRLGTAVSVDENRTGKFIPLELLASEIVPTVVRVGGTQEMVVYANEPFSLDTYKKLIAYGLNFGTGLVTTISIGTQDFNPARDATDAEKARLTFNHRIEEVTPFCVTRSILDLLQGT